MDQAVVDQAFGGVVVRFRPGSFINGGVILPIPIRIKEGIARRLWITQKNNAVGASPEDMAAIDGEPSIIVVHENTVPSELVQEAVPDRTIFRPIDKNRSP